MKLLHLSEQCIFQTEIFVLFIRLVTIHLFHHNGNAVCTGSRMMEKRLGMLFVMNIYDLQTNN